jgi:hypothetical protein
MALNSNAFVEGIDPTSTFGGYASVLLQLIRQALPSSTYGMVLYDSATPDVSGANAWRQRCVWIDMTNTASPVAKVYRTTGSPGWVSVISLIVNNTITTAMIQDAAVTLAKLSVAGGTANQLIRVNAGATAFEFVNFSSLFTVGVVPINSIVTSAVPPSVFRVLGSFGGAAATWFTANDIVSELSVGSIDALAVAPAGTLSSASRFLTSRTADTGAVWRLFDPVADVADGGISGVKLTNGTATLAKLAQSGATTGQVASWNGSSWAPAAPASGVTKYVTATASIPAMPLASQEVSFTHGLAGIPQSVRVVLYCVTNDAATGYVAGDELDASYPFSANGFSSDDQGTPFNLRITTSSIIFSQNSLGWDIYVAHKTTRAVVAITQANWGVRAYALYIA